jgi:hypothetical protein
MPEMRMRLLEALSVPPGTSRRYFIYTGLLCTLPRKAIVDVAVAEPKGRLLITYAVP